MDDTMAVLLNVAIETMTTPSPAAGPPSPAAADEFAEFMEAAFKPAPSRLSFQPRDVSQTPRRVRDGQSASRQQRCHTERRLDTSRQPAADLVPARLAGTCLPGSVAVNPTAGSACTWRSSCGACFVCTRAD